MEEEGSLVYEEEIVPNISTHAVRAMEDGIEDVCVVKRMLKILTHHPFDTDRIQHNNQSILSFFLLFLNQSTHSNHIISSLDDSRTTFRECGGIECLLLCHVKHNELAKEIISCLVNAVGKDGTKHTFHFKTLISHFLPFSLKLQRQVQRFFLTRASQRPLRTPPLETSRTVTFVVARVHYSGLYLILRSLFLKSPSSFLTSGNSILSSHFW